MRKFLLFTLLSSTIGFGQTTDAELWTGIGVNADLSKKLSLKYETQTRFYKNASTLKTYYNEFAANYSPIKRLGVGVSYRYARKNRENYYSGDNRFCLNSSYGYKIGETNLRIKARARYQFSFDRLSVINNIIYPSNKHLFRLKLDLRYKNKSFKRVAPFVGYELFKSLQNDNTTGLNAFRVYTGINFDLPGKHEVGIKYIFEHENGTQLSSSHNYVIQYNYQIPSKWFKNNKK